MRSDKQIGKDSWTSFKRDKDVIYSEHEEQVFGSVTQEQFEDLRFRISNMDLRLVECTNHPDGISFGFRLHPPHLWDIKDGKLYKKVKGRWVRFIPKLEDNVSRFNNT